jgi:hypothetical protein
MNSRIKPGMLAALMCCGALVLAGCAGSDSSTEASSASPTSAASSQAPAPSESPSETTTEDLEAVGDIEVDNGLLSVTVTVPADLAEGATQADIDKAIADGEMLDGQINDDGSVTYVMSSAQHDAILDGFRASVDEIVVEEQKTNPGLYEEVTYNDEMTEFTVVVADRQRYEQSMSMLGLGLVFGGSFYQIFYGVPEADRNVVIEYVDGATGDVFDTYNAREDMS